MKGRVYAVSSESKEDEVYQRMVVEECIDIQTKGKKGEEGQKIRVLITTSVIDNGVNFRNIQNVVTSDISRVKTLQMLGRARVSKGESVTHYIKRFSENELAFVIDKLKLQQDAYHDYRTSSYGKHQWFVEKYYHGSEENWKNAKHWFGREGRYFPKLFPNDIAVALVDSLVPTYEAILKEMQESNPNELPGQKYLEYQLSWLGKEYSRENDITLKDKDEGLKCLLEFLRSYADNNTKMLVSDQMKFREGHIKFRSCTCSNISKCLMQHNNSPNDGRAGTLPKRFSVADMPQIKMKEVIIMKKVPESIIKCVEMVMLIRPSLTTKQAIAAGLELHKEMKSYLEPSEGHPSVQRAIYLADMTDGECAAYHALSFDEQRMLYSTV